MVQTVSRDVIAQRYNYAWHEIAEHLAVHGPVVYVPRIRRLPHVGCKDDAGRWVVSCPLADFAAWSGSSVERLWLHIESGQIFAYRDGGEWFALVYVLGSRRRMIGHRQFDHGARIAMRRYRAGLASHFTIRSQC